MDGQNYLNQISQQARPVKKSGGFMKSPLFFGLIGAVVAMILIIVIGSSLGGGESLSEQSISLKYYIDGVTEVIDEYQDYVKSPKLRSSSASLGSILSNTSKELTNYLSDSYGFKEESGAYPKLQEEAELSKDVLAEDLFNAKIGGTLDRIYAHKMAYEIELIMEEESDIYDKTPNETLKSLLETSYNSLENLYKDFDDFSESK